MSTSWMLFDPGLKDHASDNSDHQPKASISEEIPQKITTDHLSFFSIVHVQGTLRQNVISAALHWYGIVM